MSTLDNLTDFLTDVADAIRTKTNTTGTINPQDFSDKILNIEIGCDLTHKIVPIILERDCPNAEGVFTNADGSVINCYSNALGTTTLDAGVTYYVVAGTYLNLPYTEHNDDYDGDNVFYGYATNQIYTDGQSEDDGGYFYQRGVLSLAPNAVAPITPIEIGFGYY